MKEQINKIKDLMYEAEGLLELLQLRQDKFEDLRPLIKTRISEALNLTDALENTPAPVADIRDSEDDYEPADSSGNSDDNSDSADSYLSSEEGSEPSAPTFCLNDKFRFRRAIFGGNKEEFENVMNHIATLDDYDEAENFLLYDMDLDMEDPDVADFVEVIRNYFEKR